MKHNTAVENLKPFAHAAQNRCFGCGPANPGGLYLEFFVAPDGAVICPATVPDTFEGHPGYLHGGIIATLLDETMSKSVRALGLIAMTRHLEVDYRLPVPSSTAIQLEGQVVRSEGRKHWSEARIRDSEGKILARSKGLFVEVQPKKQS
ncbi:MAG TPA: PaaI family thioesterase [Terracidiphilus sp.]|nr:PaaI family thioesterase [Terracidiphilus sp.]